MSLSVRELLEAGVHFGHQTHRWNPKMRPYIYGARNGIYIIDLQSTARLWKEAYDTIVETVRRGGKVLFVGTKPQAQEVILEESNRGDQYYVNRRWLGGMLTNFQTIKNRIERLEELETLKESDRYDKLPKKELVLLEKERQKLDKALIGIKKMKKLPALVVIVDPRKEHIAVKEARKLQIPIIAITDTNCDPDGIDFVVPGNDDAIKSIRLFLNSAAQACLEGRKAYEIRIQEETQKARAEQEAAEQAEAAAAKKAEVARTKNSAKEAERLAASPNNE